MNRFFDLATNSTLFTILMALSPAVFAAMFMSTGSAIAAIAVSVAYVSLLVGERLDC